MKLEDVLEGIAFECVKGDTDVDVSALAFASNKVVPGGAFFCIPGFKSDGHDYAQDAVNRGAAALVVERELDIDVTQFRVESSRATLPIAAANFYGQPSSKLKICGITGTNGKTTTTFLLEWIARSYGLATGLIGTVETRIKGVSRPTEHTTPESLDLQALFAEMVDADVELAGMEVSSHALSLGRTMGTRFAVAAFSNLTQDHLDYHHDMESYFRAKQLLFDYPDVGARVVCIDDEYGRRLYEHCKTAHGNMPLYSVGLGADADFHPENVSFDAGGTSLTLVTPEGDFDIVFPLIGTYNVQNLLLAAGVAYAAGIPAIHIAHALEQSPQVPGRLERVMPLASDNGTPGAGCTFSVFVDYAHTPDAIDKALAAVKAITRNRTFIVFGCGGDRDPGKRPKMGRAAAAADFAIVTSDNPRSEDPLRIIDAILPGLVAAEGRYEVEPDRRNAIKRAIELAEAGDTILVAGKGHEDYQLVGDKVLSFDDRKVAAEELAARLNGSEN